MSSPNGKTPDARRLHTFVAIVEDKPGVLNRVASLIRRRGFNIHSLTVGPTDQEGVSRMTIVVRTDEVTARHVEANLYKLVNVLRVEDITDTASVERDLALIKVRANADDRAQVLQICEVFRARAIDIAQEALILEITGTEEKIDGLLDVLRPFGIIEMSRTGRVAMTRGSAEPTFNPEFVSAELPETALA
jgi:acetolactate synthase-1/3 small subunit